MRRGIVVAYWASTELCFINVARRRCEAANIPFRVIRIAHHPEWFTARRPILRNVWHLARVFAAVVCAGTGASVCVFGTNACRVLYPFAFLFRRTILVYNEMPEVSQEAPLRWYDRWVFHTARHRFVSTQLRAEFIVKAFDLARPIDVLENLAVTSVQPVIGAPRRAAAVFAGAVTRKRFSDEDLEKFRRLSRALGEKIVVYGQMASTVSPEFGDFAEFRGSVSHREMLEVMLGYRYGLLAYVTEDLNCDLCAPIKLFEYVAQGCQAISINRNAGLLSVAKDYPALIRFADGVDGAPEPPSPLEFERQRAAFLDAALASNERFVDLLMS